MDFISGKVIARVVSSGQEAALNALSFRFLSVLPILEQMHGLACRNRFIDLFKLDKGGPEADRPLVVALVLQRVQLIVVCLISRTFLVSLYPSLASLRLFDELRVSECFLFLFFRLFLRLQ